MLTQDFDGCFKALPKGRLSGLRPFQPIVECRLRGTELLRSIGGIRKKQVNDLLVQRLNPLRAR